MATATATATGGFAGPRRVRVTVQEAPLGSRVWRRISQAARSLGDLLKRGAAAGASAARSAYYYARTPVVSGWHWLARTSRWLASLAVVTAQAAPYYVQRGVGYVLRGVSWVLLGVGHALSYGSWFLWAAIAMVVIVFSRTTAGYDTHVHSRFVRLSRGERPLYDDEVISYEETTTAPTPEPPAAEPEPEVVLNIPGMPGYQPRTHVEHVEVEGQPIDVELPEGMHASVTQVDDLIATLAELTKDPDHISDTEVDKLMAGRELSNVQQITHEMAEHFWHNDEVKQRAYWLGRENMIDAYQRDLSVLIKGKKQTATWLGNQANKVLAGTIPFNRPLFQRGVEAEFSRLAAVYPPPVVTKKAATKKTTAARK